MHFRSLALDCMVRWRLLVTVCWPPPSLTLFLSLFLHLLFHSRSLSAYWLKFVFGLRDHFASFTSACASVCLRACILSGFFVITWCYILIIRHTIKFQSWNPEFPCKAVLFFFSFSNHHQPQAANQVANWIWIEWKTGTDNIEMQLIRPFCSFLLFLKIDVYLYCVRIKVFFQMWFSFHWSDADTSTQAYIASAQQVPKLFSGFFS